MKIIGRLLSYYFVLALPVLFAAWLIEPAITRSETSVGSALLGWGNAVFGAAFAFWMIAAIYIAFALVFSQRFREKLLKRITFMKERDEREEMVVGRAARNAFILNLAMLIFLFILNLISINVTKLPPGKAIDGKQHNLFLGLNYYPIKKGNAVAQEPSGESLYDYEFPVTVSGVLTMLMIMNIGSFCYYARKIGRG